MTDYFEWVPVVEYSDAQKEIMETPEFKSRLEALVQYFYGRGTCSLDNGVSAMLSPDNVAAYADWLLADLSRLFTDRQKVLPPLQKTLTADLGQWSFSRGL